MKARLNERQKRFVAEYLVDLNATQAAIRAGYSAKTAETSGPRLLGNVRVAEAIKARHGSRLARVEVKADDILRELLRIGTSDIRAVVDERGRLRPIHDIPEDTARAISGIEVEEVDDDGAGAERPPSSRIKKLKFWDKPRALEMLGKHLALFAETLRVETPKSITVTLNGIPAPDYTAGE